MHQVPQPIRFSLVIFSRALLFLILQTGNIKDAGLKASTIYDPLIWVDQKQLQHEGRTNPFACNNHRLLFNTYLATVVTQTMLGSF